MWWIWWIINWKEASWWSLFFKEKIFAQKVFLKQENTGHYLWNGRNVNKKYERCVFLEDYLFQQIYSIYTSSITSSMNLYIINTLFLHLCIIYTWSVYNIYISKHYLYILIYMIYVIHMPSIHYLYIIYTSSMHNLYSIG